MRFFMRRVLPAAGAGIRAKPYVGRYTYGNFGTPVVRL
jgi:hypothetical protein